MDRIYLDGKTDSADFFQGIEVEHTPAYKLPTLFVVGLKRFQDIYTLVKDNDLKHIFFGANHSFNPIVPQEWNAWEEMIKNFLNRNYLCSLDIPITAVREFNDTSLNQYHNFIPQIRISIPNVNLWNYNTMVKIDDIDFDATNPGVWTHSLHSLKDRSKFTSWDEYSKDKVIK